MDLLSARPPLTLLPKRAVPHRVTFPSCVHETLQALTLRRRVTCRIELQAGDWCQPVRTDTASVAAPIRAPLEFAPLRTPFACCSDCTTLPRSWIPTQMPNRRRRFPADHHPAALRTPKGLKGGPQVSVLRPHRCYPSCTSRRRCLRRQLRNRRSKTLLAEASIFAPRGGVLCGSNGTPSFRRGEVSSFRGVDFLTTHWTCASETVSCTDTKCACRLGKRVLCSPQRKLLRGIWIRR